MNFDICTKGYWPRWKGRRGCCLEQVEESPAVRRELGMVPEGQDVEPTINLNQRH